MKKIYFLMIALLVSVAANAQLYVVGNGDGLNWDPTNPMEVAKGADGLYSFTIKNCVQVQLSTTKAGWDAGWKAAAKKVDGTVVAGENTLVNGDGDIYMPYKGDWTFVIDWDNNKLTLSTESEEQALVLYVRGDMNSWGVSDDWKFSTTDNKNYTLDNVSISASQSFKIGDADWAKSLGTENSPLALDQDAVLKQMPSGGDIKLAKNFSGNISFNIETMTIHFTSDGQGGEEPEPTITELFLVGGFNSWLTGDTNYQFTYSEGTYTLNIPALNGQFKICGRDWNNYPSFGGDSAGEDVEYVDGINGENSLWKGSSVNINANNWTNVSISFSWNQTDANIIANISFDETVTPSEPRDLYIVGDAVGEWNTPKDEYKMTREDNVYTYTFDNGITGAWKIAGELEGATDWQYSFGRGNEDAEPAVDKTVDVWFNSATNFNISGNYNQTGKVKITLTVPDGSNVQSSSIPATLKMELDTNTGVDGIDSDVAPAEYFNLQGVKVANPENGIFIVVRNGKATKEFMK